MTGGRALDRCVGDGEAFLAEHFGSRPYRSRGPDGFVDLLSLDDVDALLSGSGLRRPNVRLVRDGEVLDPATWTRRARTGRVWVDDLVHPGKALDLFADGATIVLQSLHRWWPPLTRFCRDLELELGHAVQANAYLTPPGAAGLTPHHDTHDVFVLQVEGTKEWVLREAIVDSPIARQRSDHDEAAAQPVVAEERLSPGDCLYLPRGAIHSARTQQGASLHVTIGLLATTAHDLVRRIVDAVGDDATFRRTLPVGFGTDAKLAAETIRQVADELVTWLGGLDPDALAEAEVERFVRHRSPVLRGQLSELLGLDDLDVTTPVRLRPGTFWHTAIAGERVAVTAGDRRVELPVAAERPVRRLLDGNVHRVAEFDDVDEVSGLVLVRRLVREGILVTVADRP